VNENIGVDLLAVDETPMDIFITHNLRLVRNLALKASLSSPLVEIEDLFQMGVFGLVRAIEKWDWSLGYKFSTYAVWWIRQSINRLSIDSDQLIRIPVHARDSHISKRNALVKKYELGNEMSILIGLSKNSYEDVDWLETFVFENTFMGHESLTGLRYQTGEIRVKCNIPNNMPDYLWDPAYQYEQYELKERLAWVLDTLSEREAEVIILRYGLVDGAPKTLDEIGKVYGVTRERIRQIESKVMSKLRHPARSDVLRDFLD
jgi:RNA polymerase primary sigma factor